MSAPVPVEILPFTESDLEWALDLARTCFRAPWSRGMFLEELRHEKSLAFKALLGGHAAGFLFVRDVYDRCELLSLAVEPSLRRSGVGRRLLNTAVRLARERLLPCITLEVSHRNTGAVSFYQALGFVVVGRRPNYYPEEQADALLMDLPVAPGGVS